MCRGCTTSALYPNPRLNPQELYSSLIEELVDNSLQQRQTRRRTHNIDEKRDNHGAAGMPNLSPQLRATVVTKRRNDGNMK